MMMQSVQFNKNGEIMRYKANIRGILTFTREITIYACNETDAKIVADELTMKSIADGDRCKIKSIEIKVPETTYEIGVKITDKDVDMMLGDDDAIDT